MPNIKFENILGGMNWDAPAHTHKQPTWGQMRNARTWVRSVENVGGWVPEFNFTLGITQPTMTQFWQALNSGGASQGYFVYALAGNIRRASPAGDSDIRGLNPIWQPTLSVASVVSSTQLRGTGIGTAFTVGSFISSGASTTPTQVTGVIDANNVSVVSVSQWQPTSVLLVPVVMTINSSTTLVGTGLGSAVQVGNNISATSTGTPTPVTAIIDANTITVSSTAQWGSVGTVTNPTVYAWTKPALASLFLWQMGNYVNALTGAALTNSASWYFTAFSGGYNMVVGNESITPQYMSGDLTNLLPLPGFTYGSINDSQVIATTAKVVKAFGPQLIAGNLQHRLANGQLVQRPSTIRFSDNSAPGGVPQTWQNTAQNAADEFELNTTDPIQDIIIFKNYAVVLTTNSAFLATNSSSTSPTQVSQINPVRGLLTRNAAQVVDGWLYIVTTDDILVTDGTPNNWKSISNDIVKSYFFEDELNVNPVIRQSLFMRFHRYFNELIIPYPSKVSLGACDRALIYGIDDQAWSWTDLPNIYDATLGPVVGNADALRPWPVNSYNYNITRLHFASGNQIEAFDIGYARPGIYGPYLMDLQKYFDFSDIQGLDASQVKQILRLYFKFTSVDVTTNTPAPSTISVYIKTFNTPIQSPPFLDWTTWDWFGTYDVAGANPDFQMVPSLRCRYMAMRITSNATNRINLTEFELQVTAAKEGAFG